MKKLYPLLLSAALLSPSAMASDELLAEARGTAKMLGKSLLGQVKKSMKAGGPVPTIALCNDIAPKLADDVSQKSGWDVGRTSLKLRNPNNAPDAWELAVLKSFEERKAKGEPVKGMEYAETVTLNGKPVYRYMKAIPTGKPCLHCHAAEIKPKVEATLKSLYPDDKARGFKLGDIRGAFTLQKQL